MKKTLKNLTLALAVMVTGALTPVVTDFVNPFSESDTVIETPATKVKSNVGDGLQYVYEITDVDWTVDEIHGVPLTRESETNKGIFLYPQEVPFDVEPGDRIAVVWGDTEDEFASIERAYQLEDGSWVGKSYFE